MGRSKKNWDFLVDYQGNYRDLTVGDKGGLGPKGNKGDKGFSPNIFHFEGEVPTYGDLPAPGPGTEGAVYKVADTDEYYASDGEGNYVLLPGVNSLKGEKGEKGEKGQKGFKGEKGRSSPVFTYKGEVPDAGSLPSPADPGDVYKDISTGDFYAYGEDGNWSVLPGVTALKGDKGQKGEKGVEQDVSDFVTGGELSAELDLYYNKTETDNKLSAYWTKGQTEAEFDKHYDKGEVDQLLTNYYTKGETYDRNYIDAKDNNRYTKGEVDALLEANKGTTYTYTTTSPGPASNEADLVLTNENDNTTQNIKIKANPELGLSMVGNEITIGGNFSQPLSYLGTITPPADPATLEANPADGNFFIYDSSGTAWNGDAVQAGYWVVYDNAKGWENILIGVDSGVTSVDVSGGVLSLEGTTTDPVINLDKVDLENALNDRYLRVDGTNNYVSTKLNFAPTDNTARVNLNTNSSGGLALTLGNSYALTLTSTLISSSKDVRINNNKSLEFAGGNGTKLNVLGSTWGILSSQGDYQIQWGVDGIHMHEPISMDGNGNTTGLQRIINMADPIADQDAATKKYVDDNAGDVLPVATSSVLGGVKIGNNVNVTVDGTISVPTVKGQKGQKGQTGSGQKGQKGATGSSGSSGTFVKGSVNTILITKSGSNYYISG